MNLYITNFMKSPFEKIENYFSYEAKVETAKMEKFYNLKHTKLPQSFIDFYQKLSSQKPTVFNKALTLIDFAVKYPIIVFDKEATKDNRPVYLGNDQIGQSQLYYKSLTNKFINYTKDRDIAAIALMGQWMAFQGIEKKVIRDKVGHCLEKRRLYSNVDRGKTLEILEKLKAQGLNQNELIEKSIALGQMYIDLLTAFVNTKDIKVEDNMFKDFMKNHMKDLSFEGEDYATVFVKNIKNNTKQTKEALNKNTKKTLGKMTKKELVQKIQDNNIEIENKKTKGKSKTKESMIKK